MDKNGDGMVELDETPEKMRARISKLDSNGDGQLSLEEFSKSVRPEEAAKPAEDAQPRKRKRGEGNDPAAKPAKPDQPEDAKAVALERFKKLMTRLDKNSDGKLELEEAPEGMRKRLENLDKNGDKSIDESEWLAGSKVSNAKGEGALSANATRWKELFEKYDTDKDGKIDLSQVDEVAQKRLKQHDANDDGMLDATEARSALRKMEARDGKGDGKARKGDDPENKNAPDSAARKKARKKEKQVENSAERAPQEPKRPAADTTEGDKDK